MGNAALWPSNRGAKLPGEVCTREEVGRLLDACGGHRTGRRNRAAIVLMHRGGLRCAEALSVRACDLTLADNGGASVRVLRPKGAGRGKPPRVVGLGPTATAVLRDWLAVREAPATATLCCTRTHRPVATAYMRRLLPRLAHKAGVDHRVHPHALRHSWAYDAAMRGMPTPILMRALGHTSLLVTAKYIDHLAPADVVAAMQEE